MSKRFQNRIAESRHTLPITAFYSICIWLLAGRSGGYSLAALWCLHG